MNAQQQLFDIARKIKTNNSKYEFMGSFLDLPNYRIITDGEVQVKGRDIDLPHYVKAFIAANKEVILIANIIKGKVCGMVLRGTKEKNFLTFDMKKGALYGLGTMDSDFHYGETIVLVESAIDCDTAKMFLTKNCLALLTSSVSEAKAMVLACLTNRVLLLLDNDEAGLNGESKSKYRLEKYGVSVVSIPKVARIKDLGDLMDLYRSGDIFARTIITDLKSSISLRGGKVL
jgi:hypothetical protein